MNNKNKTRKTYPKTKQFIWCFSLRWLNFFLIVSLYYIHGYLEKDKESVFCCKVLLNIITCSQKIHFFYKFVVISFVENSFFFLFHFTMCLWANAIFRISAFLMHLDTCSTGAVLMFAFANLFHSAVCAKTCARCIVLNSVDNLC